MWTDAHCHLDRENTDDAAATLARARAAGVSRLIAVGVGRGGAALQEVRALSERDANVWFTAGIHPHDAAGATREEIEAVREALAHPRCVALGEVGLDFYYDNSPREAQRALFAEMIALAKAAEKPLMLHVRDANGSDGAASERGESVRTAHDEALAMLAARPLPAAVGVVHCFTQGFDLAERYLALGFSLSIPGIITFKNAAPLADAVARAPRARIVVETDAPYLAPIPMRGKKNEPAFLPYTGRKIAELWGVPEAEVARVTTENAARLFGLDSV